MKQDYVPLISLENFETLDITGKREISRKIDQALKGSGFFICTDHGVSAQMIKEVQEASYAYFDLPMEEKMQAASRAAGSPRGYIPYGVETLSVTDGRMAPPDIKEGYGIGPYWVDHVSPSSPSVSSTYTPNVWPERPEQFKELMLSYYRQMEGLTQKLMELFAIGMDLDPKFFVEKFKRHNSTFRLVHYPAQDHAPEPGQLRAGEHTDYGALTILLAEAKQGGLQVRKPNGQWEDVAPPPGAFVINIGDLMMHWSNDRWLSNYHRVVNPPSDAGAAARRLSAAYFCNPEDSLMIECIPTCCSKDAPPKYPPIQAGEHRMRKINLSKKLTTPTRT
jgi:isopenicillin N synthase-like dioxygenase